MTFPLAFPSAWNAGSPRLKGIDSTIPSALYSNILSSECLLKKPHPKTSPLLLPTVSAHSAVFPLFMSPQIYH
jgi:hypothetical protein